MAAEEPHPKNDPVQPPTDAPPPNNPASEDALPFDDAKTDQAIDDIVAQESDELLAAQDVQQAAAPEPRLGFWRRFGRALTAPWRYKWARYTLLLLIAASIAMAAILPTVRYYLLNAYGVKVSSSVIVTDDITHQPLKNVEVRIGSISGRTGIDGKVTLRGLPLGPTSVSVTRPGFSMYERRVTLGWGSNPLGTVALKAVGMRYTFVLKDYVTEKAVEGVEVRSGDASAVSDKQGKAVLTLPGGNEAEISVDITHGKYRAESVSAKPLGDAVPVTMVSSRKAIYVSKEHGTYDVYSSDIDGKNRQILLPGSGSENANISLAVSPDGSRAALVSTRDNKRDANGVLLPALTIIDVSDGSNVTIAHASQIRLLDWIGTRLVFEQVTTDKDVTKHVITSYDYVANTRLQLATAPRFASVLSAQGAIYYASPPDESNSSAQKGLLRVGIDGSNKQTIFDKDVWAMYRTDYNTLQVQTAEGWYAVHLAGGSQDKTGAPALFASRRYAENPAHPGRSIWADVAGGQGVLREHNRQTGKDTAVHTQGGLTYPLRWLTEDSVMYRVVTGSETADYIVSALGGTPHKVADVVNTFGFTAGQ